jgi:hypothetical protein
MSTTIGQIQENMAIEPEKSLFGHCTFAFILNKDLPKSQAVLVVSLQIPLTRSR